MVVVIVAVIVLILFIVAIVLGVRYVVTSKKPEDDKIAYIKNIAGILEQCKLESSNDAIRDKINNITETLRYGDTNSTPAATEIEKTITKKALELLDLLKGKKTVEINTALDELLKSVQERNIITKYTK